MNNRLVNEIGRLVSGLKNRIRMMVARAVITTVNDAAKVQQMQVKLLAGEMADKVERFQEYGFTSSPLAGMEAAVVFINGDRGNPIIVGIGDRTFRFKNLANGEVALYTDEGDHIHFKRGNTIAVKTLHLEVDAEDDVTYNTKAMIINAADSLTINTTAAAVNASASIDTTTRAFTQAAGMFTALAGITWGGTAQGLNGAAAVVQGDIEITGESVAADHISNGKSGATHTHNAPNGGGQTGEPQ